jgi:quercetin dioxygenase-like cupin family protein|tara:strand:- start:174 stop:563 length:390 start_codon:yes stop_codon:yes gene_type:complete
MLRSNEMNLEFPHFCTDDENVSQVKVWSIGTKEHGHGTYVSDLIECHSVRLAETAPGGVYDWHPAPRKQYVVTLTGTIEFTFGNGEILLVKAGDVFLANDLEGKGHKWKIVGDEPWRRLYVHLDHAPVT